MATLLSILALAVGIVALIVAIKKKPSERVVVEKETKVVEQKTTDFPFVYDSSRKLCKFDGTLEVTGGLVSLKKQEG